MESRGGLTRGLGLLEATALNMSNMIGVGPFITIPLILTAMGGPQAMLGWLVGLIIAAADGMVWAELGAALPSSGGTYVYLREAFGRYRWGRLATFLFIWQFILSGPLEIASGYVGLAQYAGYIWPLSPLQTKLLAAGAGALNVVLLYRGIKSVGRLTVVLWSGALLAVLAVICAGASRFSPAMAFDFPPGAFHLSRAFWLGLGAASSVAVYDYLGYYDVCYVAQEVRDPGRVIPRAIFFALLAVAVIYFFIYMSVIGVLPWKRAMASRFVVSELLEVVWGRRAASALTWLILWTALGSTFALLLGYSRIPYAAAKDGNFFKPFARLHPEGFPNVSLLVVGGMSMAASFVSLDALIAALLTTRILIQFMGQIAAVVLLRRHAPELKRPYRMALYPLPCIVAGAGWLFIFGTAGWAFVLGGLGLTALGVGAFFLWDARSGPKTA